MPPTRPYRVLGELLAELRGDETQTDAARRIGINRTYLADIEGGLDLPSVAMLARLVSGYGAESRQAEADAILLRLVRERDATPDGERAA